MEQKETIKIIPIREIGGSREGTLEASYDDIVDKIGPPNVTDLDDANKVKASWGFKDEKGRKGFIWCYKWYGNIYYCKSWSISGTDLLNDLFPEDIYI